MSMVLDYIKICLTKRLRSAFFKTTTQTCCVTCGGKWRN